MKREPAAVLGRLSHGVYVIGVADAEQQNAFTAAWVMQVSFDPILVALSINPGHASYELLQRGGVFSVNVLGEDRQDLARHFGTPGQGGDKLAGTDWRCGETGAPILGEAMAWLECEVSHECPAGDHVLVIGRVVNGAVADARARALQYRDTGDMDGGGALFPDSF